ncbi:MAG: hypothetical protein WC497_04350 [Patescibacteria group bacterium]
MKKLTKIVSILSLAGLALLTFAPTVSALTIDNGYGTNIYGTDKPLSEQITAIIQWVLGFLALVAVIMIIYGGFIWLTAAGNEERVGQAKKIISAAIIGLVIILLAWAITWFVTSGILAGGGTA